MIWAALALLGVPIWLIVGALGAVLWSRRHFKKQPGVFVAKVRLLEGDQPGIGRKWHGVYARLIHDVLLINKGVALMRVIPVGIGSVESRGRLSEAEGIRIKGRYPWSLRLQTDQGAVIEVATLAADELRCVGSGADQIPDDNRLKPS